ncbi:MAG: transposase [Christensenellales bacterium]
MNQGRDTTKEERLAIVKDCLASGKNYGEMAQKHQVSYQQVRTWTLKYEELGAAGLEDRRGKRKRDQRPRTELEAAQIEIERLKHQLYLAEMERDLLKNWTRSRGGMPFASETVSSIPGCLGMPCREKLPG